jgi:hypothetical protein
MNVPAVVVVSLCLGISVKAGEIKSRDQARIDICMEPGSTTPWIVAQAERTASMIFNSIGVQIDWHHGARGCRTAPVETIHVYLSAGVRETEFPGALAWTRVGDGTRRIEVFFDRIAGIVEPIVVPTVLAHTLAHEVGHVLEGINHHSKEGVMKAHWDQHDYWDMAFKPLSFASEDAALIKSRLASGTLKHEE